MKARLLTKWGERQVGEVIEHAEKLDPPIPPHAAEFFEDDAEVEATAVELPEAEEEAPQAAKRGRKGSARKKS